MATNKATEKVEKKDGPTTKSVTLIMPLGLPGMGKSTFYDQVLGKWLKGNDASLISISNDSIRQRLLDTYRRQHPKSSIDDAFAATRSALAKEVEAELEFHILDQQAQPGDQAAR